MPRAPRRPLAAACLALACAWPAARAEVLTWREVLGAAQSTHPQVRARLAALAASQAELEGTQWRRYPTPTVEAGTPGSGSSRLVRLDQPLWSAGRIDAAIEAAGRRTDAAEGAVQESRRDLVLRALAAVSDAARQTERAEVNARNLAEHDRLLALIRRRVAQEVSPLADESLALARRAVAASDLSQSRQALRTALAQLAQLTGRSVDRVDTAGYADAARLRSRLVDELRPAVLAASPTLRRLRSELQAAEADVAERRGARWPQVLLRLEHQSGGSTQDTRARVVLSYQPGAGLSAQAGVAAAEARRDSAREAIEAAEREVEQQLALDLNDAISALERVDVTAQVRASSTDVAESYARQYTVGRKSWLDVLNAVREASQAELALVDTRHQAWLAALRLQVLAGDPDLLGPGAATPTAAAPATARP
jgi:adhesin transport system outer membrane protein